MSHSSRTSSVPRRRTQKWAAVPAGASLGGDGNGPRAATANRRVGPSGVTSSRAPRWAGHQTAVDTLLSANPPIRLRPSEEQQQHQQVLMSTLSLSGAKQQHPTKKQVTTDPDLGATATSVLNLKEISGGDAGTNEGSSKNASGTRTPSSLSESKYVTLDGTISLQNLSAALAEITDDEVKEQILARAKGTASTPPLVREHRHLNEKKLQLESERWETEKLEERLLGDVERVLLGLEGEAIKQLSQRVGGSRVGVSATRRGLALPYAWYGEATKAVQDSMAKVATRPYVDLSRSEELIDPPRIDSDPSSCSDDYVEEEHDEEDAKFADDTTAGRNNTLAGRGRILSCKKIVKKRVARRRVFRLGKVAMLKVSTASTVAILWRMLEQVAGPVVGMSNALDLFKSLLHVVYADFDRGYKEVEEVPEPSLAAQIAQFTKLKLHATQSAELEIDCNQLNSDVEFYSKAMENWGFQIWRQGKLGSRRKESFMLRLEKIVKDLEGSKRKSVAFNRWKEYVGHRQISQRVLAFEDTLKSLDPNGKDWARHTAEAAHITPPPPPPPPAKSLQNSQQISSDVVSSLHQTAEKHGITYIDTVLPLLAPKTVESKLEHITNKMKELADVNGVIRAQVAIFRKKVVKLTHENVEVKQKLRAVEEKEVDLLDQLLSCKNELQEKEEAIHKLKAEVARLSNRVRLQDHRRWRSAAMAVTETLCGVTSARSKEFFASGGEATITHLGVPGGPEKRLSATGRQGTDEFQAGTNPIGGPSLEEKNFQMFPRPVVTSSCFASMANPIEVVQDWVNRCLDELGQLEQSGSWHSQRVSEFSFELRDGTIASRLLFYLSLPRYEAMADEDDSKMAMASGLNTLNRQRLLEGNQTQTRPPFPTYNDAFNDLSRMNHLQRNATILEFASQLISGAQGGSTNHKSQFMGRGVSPVDYSLGGGPPPGTQPTFPLHSIVTPTDLTDGNRNAALTFFAALYCCFAHPFNHKSDEELLHEPSQHRQLCVQLHNQLHGAMADERPDQASVLLQELSPPLGSEAHMALLEGQFWSDDQITESEGLRAMITIVSSLNQSLQRHKWTVAAGCLLPLSTSASLFRLGNRPALLTGAAAIQAGAGAGPSFSLDHLPPTAMDDEVLHPSVVDAKRRDKIVVDAERMYRLLTSRHETAAATMGGASGPPQHLQDPKPVAEILDVLQLYAQDLISLFMRYSTISVVMGTRCMGIKEWRQLWQDCGTRLATDVLMQLFLHVHLETADLAVEGLKSGSDFGPSGALPSPSPHGGAQLLGGPPAKTLVLDDGDTKSVRSRHGAQSDIGGGSKYGVSSENWRTINSYEMLFEDFIEGVVRVASKLTPVKEFGGGSGMGAAPEYSAAPSLSATSPRAGATPGGSPLFPQPTVTTTKLAEGLASLITSKILMLPRPTDFTMFVEGVQRMECRRVLHKRTNDIHTIFAVYAKQHKGHTTMDLPDLMKLAKEAGWITHELTAVMLGDLAIDCLNGRESLRLIPLQALGGLDTQAELLDPSERLMSERDFIHVLLVVSCYKYPSPFQPLYKKVEQFLNKNVIEALKTRPTTYARVYKTMAVNTQGSGAQANTRHTPQPPQGGGRRHD